MKMRKSKDILAIGDTGSLRRRLRLKLGVLRRVRGLRGASMRNLSNGCAA